jgi:AcrR family transcriptional regulator
VPAKGDHEARRQDVSQAVWEVLASKGFGGLTMRAVATQMGASTGLVTHYFPSKQALIRHALELAHTRTDSRSRLPTPAPGLAGLRAALLDVMPSTPEGATMSRVWVGFWDAALADADLSAAEAWRYERWRGMLRPHIEAAIHLGEMSPETNVDDAAAAAAAFGHGIVIQALFDASRFPPSRQASLVDTYIATLRRAP